MRTESKISECTLSKSDDEAVSQKSLVNKVWVHVYPTRSLFAHNIYAHVKDQLGYR